MELILLIPNILLIGFMIWRENQHERQMQALLDRIQAPQQVIAQRAPEPSVIPLNVDSELDSDWEQYLDDQASGKAI